MIEQFISPGFKGRPQQPGVGVKDGLTKEIAEWSFAAHLRTIDNERLTSHMPGDSSSVVPSTLFALGVNHRTAPVEVREKLFLNDSEVREFLALVSNDLPECLVLSTCNRTEIYGVTDSPDFSIKALRDLLIDFKDASSYVSDEHFFELISCSACQQLFSVATSIDSRVVGDLQILRQLRSSYAIGRDERTVGKVLNQLLQRSFKIGKKTFTETTIHDGAVSASLAAVEVGVEFFGSLKDKKALVVGAGETSRLTAEALINKNIGELIVCNRSQERAVEMLKSLETKNTRVELAEFEDLASLLGEVDLVVTATGSTDPIISARDLTNLSKSLLLLDLAVPRDIDPAVADLPDVILKNIDDVQVIVSENHERRLSDVPKVKKLIAHEMVDFLTWYYTLPLLPQFERRGTKPTVDEKSNVLKIKEFLSANVSEIHKLYVGSNGDFQQDLDSHIALVERLRLMKSQEFERSSV